MSDLEREQDRAENELEPVRDRLNRNQHRIADGSVADPKALSPRSRRGRPPQAPDRHPRGGRARGDGGAGDGLGREPGPAAGGGVDRSCRPLEAQLEAKRATQLPDQADEAASASGPTRSPGPPARDLLTFYDKLGASHSGVGAAELRRRRCTGCQLDINAADLRVFIAAPADEVLRCEECGRILVRTASPVSSGGRRPVGSCHARPRGRPARRACPPSWPRDWPASARSWRCRTAFPPEVLAAAEARPPPPPGCPSWTAPTSSWSRSTRPGRATSTRPCTSRRAGDGFGVSLRHRRRRRVRRPGRRRRRRGPPPRR